jgi:GGDEF domain-containing protein
MRDVVGEQGLAARWSGDEFVALVSDATVASASAGAALPNATTADAEPTGDALAADVIEQRLGGALVRNTPGGLPFAVTASVGARRLGPDASETLATALAAADAGLYRRRGRSRIESAGD